MEAEELSQEIEVKPEINGIFLNLEVKEEPELLIDDSYKYGWNEGCGDSMDEEKILPDSEEDDDDLEQTEYSSELDETSNVEDDGEDDDEDEDEDDEDDCPIDLHSHSNDTATVAQPKLFCVYCSKYFEHFTEQSDHYLEEHKELDNQKIVFVCPSCGEEFADKASWQQHCIQMHDMDQLSNLSIIEAAQKDSSNATVNIFKCLKCPFVFKRSPTLPTFLNHASTHMNYKMYKCKYCAVPFDRIWAIRRHFCEELKNALKLPFNDDHDDQDKQLQNLVYVCPSCGEEFNLKETWDNHLTTAHEFHKMENLNWIAIPADDDQSKEKFQCVLCNRVWSRRRMRMMQLHAFTHMPHKLKKCRLCDSEYADIYLKLCECEKKPKPVANTLKHGHLFKKYIQRLCPCCGEQYSSTEDFNRHINAQHKFNQMKHLKIVYVKSSGGSHYKCLQCEFIFVEKSMDLFQRHAFLHMPFKLYNCIQCKAGVDTQNEIAEHLKDQHLVDISKTSRIKFIYNDAIIFHCPVCNQAFPSITEFTTHVNEDHMFNTLDGLRLSKVKDSETKRVHYECLDCDVKIKGPQYQRVAHRMTHLPYSPYKCRFCKKFVKARGIDTHLRKCSKKKRTLKKLNAEKSTETPIKKPKTNTEATSKAKRVRKPKPSVDIKNDNLDPLSLQTTTLTDISKARICNSNEKTPVMNELAVYITYACPECNIPLSTHNDWHAHISLHHNFFDEDKLNLKHLPNGKLECTECGVVVDQCVSQQQRHKLTHLPYKSFICSICSHRCNTIYVLFGHIRRRHFSHGEFKCPICALIFETSFKCVQHCKADHLEDEYPPNFCTICMTSYSSPSSLKSHMLVHEYDRNMHQCVGCERVYTSSSEMNKHLKRIHPEIIANYSDKCAKCLICSSLFNNRLLLEQHIEKHCGQGVDLGPTTCTICHASCNSPDYLQYHLRVKHLKKLTNTFLCKCCGDSFAQNSTLKKHWNRCHPDLEFPNKLKNDCTTNKVQTSKAESTTDETDQKEIRSRLRPRKSVSQSQINSDSMMLDDGEDSSAYQVKEEFEIKTEIVDGF